MPSWARCSPPRAHRLPSRRPRAHRGPDRPVARELRLRHLRRRHHDPPRDRRPRGLGAPHRPRRRHGSAQALALARRRSRHRPDLGAPAHAQRVHRAEPRPPAAFDGRPAELSASPRSPSRRAPHLHPAPVGPRKISLPFRRRVRRKRWSLERSRPFSAHRQRAHPLVCLVGPEDALSEAPIITRIPRTSERERRESGSHERRLSGSYAKSACLLAPRGRLFSSRSVQRTPSRPR